jgi:hypothetical protein
MTSGANQDGSRPVLGRVVLTMVILGAAFGTFRLMSGTLKAIEHVDHVGGALSELSRYIGDRHASIRSGVITSASLDSESLVVFESGVERRLAQFQKLNTRLQQQTTGYFWTEALRDRLDAGRVAEEQRAYRTAATQAAAAPADSLELRLFDLQAQKLLQTVDAVHDDADRLRARALIAADGILAVVSAFAVLVIAYLIWQPVFAAGRSGRGTRPAEPVAPAPPLVLSRSTPPTR